MKRESYSFLGINVHVSLYIGFASPETSMQLWCKPILAPFFSEVQLHLTSFQYYLCYLLQRILCRQIFNLLLIGMSTQQVMIEMHCEGLLGLHEERTKTLLPVSHSSQNCTHLSLCCTHLLDVFYLQ